MKRFIVINHIYSEDKMSLLGYVIGDTKTFDTFMVTTWLADLLDRAGVLGWPTNNESEPIYGNFPDGPEFKYIPNYPFDKSLLIPQESVI